MNFKCKFTSDCPRICSNCSLFENCNFCVRASECDRRNTENSCKFDDNLFTKALYKELVFELIEEDDELLF